MSAVFIPVLIEMRQVLFVVDIAKINTKQFFKDQYGIAFAVVKIVDHDEIISIESKRLLSKLFYDSNDHNVVALTALMVKSRYCRA